MTYLIIYNTNTKNNNKNIFLLIITPQYLS